MEWRYYNHAMLPTTAPHQEVDIGAVEDGSVWKLAGGGEAPAGTLDLRFRLWV